MGCYVDVSHGERVLVWADLTEATGQPIDLDEVLITLTIDGTDHVWYAPDQSEQTSAAAVRVAVLVDARFTPGIYRLYVKVSDFPESLFIAVTGGRVKVG